MRLKVLQIDSGCRSADCRREVTDMDTGKNVGFVLGRQGSAVENARYQSWSISLFDGKYTGDFEALEECAAFAAGVGAVLSHMTSTSNKRSKQRPEGPV